MALYQPFALIVQGVMTVMVSVSVHGYLKGKLLFGVKIRYI